MYKPIKEETITLLEANKAMSLEYDIARDIRGRHAAPYNLFMVKHKDPACQCYIRWSRDYLAIDDLDIGFDHLHRPPAVQELFLTLSVKRLIEFTNVSDKLSLLIFFNNEMLQLILLDHGFSIRKTTSQEIGTYKAQLKL